ncbi:MAG: Trm112 family protein [Actinomycetota bacterium]|jgi:uncharacterized protein YbaR (Trm112 family)|nr:hypothetical protein [Acidimicrobiaceae bacterium]MEC7914722.1 Trm112 family protein [Actinomycetota bacterium]MEC9473226.1 Trm112 family protein [Actinomycetota bacterium]MEE3256533.1 Trm112 family protein [Actinomycetota bacterium]
MALDPGLLEILACPDDKGPLRYFAEENILYNPRQGITYPIKDGIPVLLTSESTLIDEDERKRLDELAGQETGSQDSEN